MAPQPPRFLFWLLETLIAERYQDELVGDLHEWYYFMATRYSRRALRWRFAWEVLRSLRWFRLRRWADFIIHLIDQPMIRNDLKMAVRSTVKRRFYTGINLLGLTTGLVVCLFLFTFVQHQRSYDNFHSQGDRIYRLMSYYEKNDMHFLPVSSPMGTTLQEAFPEQVQVVSLGQDPVVCHVEDAQYYESNFFWTSASFFKVFDFPLLEGNAAQCLTEPNSIVITQRLAEKYFPNGQALGQMLDVKIYDGDTVLPMRITGVAANPPLNSHLKFDILGSMATADNLYGMFDILWGFHWLRSYLLLAPGVNPDELSAQYAAYLQENVAAEDHSETDFVLQPLSEVYLHSTHVTKASYDEVGDYRTTNIFFLVGLLVLLVAVLNFVNLSTAQLSKRAMEVGVRKSLGAARQRLLQQFLTETYLITTISLMLAVLLVVSCWSLFQQISGLAIPMSYLWSPRMLGIIGIIWLGTGLLAGLYPALAWSAYHPLQALKGAITQQGARLRQGFVTLQFTVSSLMLLGTVIIFAQFRHLMQGDLGFAQEQLMVVSVEDRTAQQQIYTLREQFAKIPGVSQVATSGESLPSQFNNTWSFGWPGRADDQMGSILIMAIDGHFFETLQVDLQEGQDFSLDKAPQEFPTQVILNEAALKIMGWEDAVGKQVTMEGHTLEVIGVAPDLHHASLKHDIGPIAYLKLPPGNRANPDNLIIRLNTDEMLSTLNQMDQLWKREVGQFPFSFHFVDEEFDHYYQDEKQFFQLFAVFSSLGILIAVVGLLGMVVYVINQRTKELSIRKVLGASVQQMVFRLGREFTVMVLLAFIISAPLGYYLGQQWLSQYPNRMELTWPIFVLTGLGSLLICWASIGYHTIRAAMANPVKHLKSE